MEHLRTDRVRVYCALPHLLGWQPSRFLADRAEAERAFALAEQLGSVNAAAAKLGTTWPSLRKAFTRHGLGMPARNPEAVRQRAIAAARHRSGQPAPADHATDGLNVRDAQPGPAARPARPQPEQGVRLCRAEEIETLSYRTVVALNQESWLAPAGASPPSPGAPNAPSAWPATARACRMPPGRACRPDRAQQPSPPPARGAGDAHRRPLAPPTVIEGDA